MNKFFLIVVTLLGAILCFTSCEKEALTPDTFTLEESTVISNSIESTAKTTGKRAAILVYWGNNQSKPVVGANVFNEKNVLVGTTGADGIAYIAKTGNHTQKFRVVEPNYGKQQAILTYPKDFMFMKSTIPNVELAAAGWTINSGVY